MMLPDYIEFEEDNGDSLPDEFRCLVCYGPLSCAVNTACQHRICRSCSQKLQEDGKTQCSFCMHLRNTEEDVELSKRVNEYVKPFLLAKAHELLEELFPPPLLTVIPQFADRFMQTDPHRLHLTRLIYELKNLKEYLSRNPVDMQNAGGISSRIVACTSQKEFDAVRGRETVLSLTIQGTWCVTLDLLFSEFSSVHELNLKGCAQLWSLSGVECLRSLTHLIVEDCGVVGAWGIEDCPHLYHIEFRRCPEFRGLSLLRGERNIAAANDNSQQLGVVRISECPLFEYIETTPSALTLRELTVSYTRFSDLTDLRSCSSLEHLDVSGCHRLTDLSPVKDLQRLTWIDISDTSVADPLATLSQLAQLTEVKMNGCNARGDLREPETATAPRAVEAARAAVTRLRRKRRQRQRA
ncbi:putative proteinadenylate cyclase regulatory protein-like protein [Leptomonas pyrrhocoris]|uniref:RING-type domain-containing protein n=1 Tax=Leptomonas pyrrhocoris TaxID=157538 RepID=A0A0M9FPR0_LEPPY|nr:putative proteinadenylate cyclase regulatory protein-like protein [Leptomonas pyrrhocoris]XP_015652004.1 putative proteinadenylate cyclase regulatory protein-like protein [Leptomonas pyrrhocoris]KPA73564.1 putative proteinadenylate cyclase regulatory protein-like protein [Leptomonas pyrrhocoris]KPA73565.1 putative proteinadenylate cyclase regulatory protein-like protein [Leptomonas pyrrhocoris]|eukprot:XP_015652003.1 putative proteinadenylate cyclase regulatory protein-like protein [Leptomonas pyrrhocoris]